MKKGNSVTVADQGYTKAHDMHYKTKDLPKAFKLYRGIIADYPETEESGYSLSQVQNIANAVAPKQEVMDALKKRIHKLRLEKIELAYAVATSPVDGTDADELIDFVKRSGSGSQNK